MLNKEEFIKYINNIVDINKEIDVWLDTLHCNIIESPLIQCVFDMADNVVKLISNGNEEIEDYINWWLYEDVEKIVWVDNKEIDVSTIEKLYNFLKTLTK